MTFMAAGNRNLEWPAHLEGTVLQTMMNWFERMLKTSPCAT